MSRGVGRTQACGRNDAVTRLAQARAFLETAELVADDEDDLATANVVAALAVLAGIAASDAACCSALGERARGQDHQLAARLVAKVSPGGPEMSKQLRRLLDIKDGAHYGMVFVSAQKARAAIRQARNLTEAAEPIVR